jgi:excisionase family DNA binding protein
MQMLEMPMFTVRESARRLGVSREVVYWWIREGKVDAVNDECGQLRIPYQELRRLMQEREGDS